MGGEGEGERGGGGGKEEGGEGPRHENPHADRHRSPKRLEAAPPPQYPRPSAGPAGPRWGPRSSAQAVDRREGLGAKHQKKKTKKFGRKKKIKIKLTF